MNSIDLTNTIFSSQNKKVFECLQKIINQFSLGKMSSEEQSIFMLEFARVIKLRIEERKSKDKNLKLSQDELLLEEIEKMQKDLAN